MPFNSIEAAKKANFPTTKEKIDLTLSQINKLAEFYDAIKKAGSAENPMAVAWTQWEETYKKEGNKWVLIEKEGEQETNAKWFAVAKKDQKKIFKDGTFEILDERALLDSLGSWENKGIEINHKAPIDASQKILAAKYEKPFLYMQFDQTTEKLFENSDASGWSVKFDYPTMEYEGEKIIKGKGENISILYSPHLPTCTPEMGCFETFGFEENEKKDKGMEEKNESGLKKIVEDLKAEFENLKGRLKGMTLIKSKKEEENREENSEEKGDMDKLEEKTLELETATAALAKSKGEFETMQTDHVKEVKELEDKVAAFEQEKQDAAKAELRAQWEQLKKELIPPGLVAKDEDAETLKGEFEQHPHAFIARMATFKKEEDKKEEGAEFESEHNESKVAIKELKEDTGRI